jgi:Domain of unknown function (DUF4389)
MSVTAAGNDNSTVPGGNSGAKPGAWILLILGALIGLIGAGLLIGGSVLSVASASQHDNGFFTTPTKTFSVGSYALTAPKLKVGGDLRASTGAPFEIATLRLQAASVEPGKNIFIGIGPTDAVKRYLSSVHHSEVSDLSYSPFSVHYRDVPGSSAPATPTTETFWTDSASGPGAQHIDWNLRSGNWSVVVMNADASSGVTVNMAAGVHSGLLGPLAVGLLVGGIVLLLIGAAMVVIGAIGLGRRTSPPTRDEAAPPTGWATPAATAMAPVPAPPTELQRSPVHLTGHLDHTVSRGLWLVKWLLAIPHYIVLLFLWFAFFVVTIIAGFAILFTGRYPKSLFTFNVGVLRWSWRVGFYAYSALGTDRYPPFTLDRTDYPADLDVDYPERLSHGLVLVKWWLLAIPHLLILAVLTGAASSWMSWGAWGSGSGQWWMNGSRGAGFSLLGILVLVAAIILLFTGRYQRPLFNLIMGVNRWVYRVIAYTALMRDDYPPFRLDQGPIESDADQH